MHSHLNWHRLSHIHTHKKAWRTQTSVPPSIHQSAPTKSCCCKHSWNNSTTISLKKRKEKKTTTAAVWKKKKRVKLKSEHFLQLWAPGPGTEHPWITESFIIWQLGSAVQFYLLAGGKWSIPLQHSKRETQKGEAETKDREKTFFMQKQPLKSFSATHRPAVSILPSASPSGCLIFWSAFARKVKPVSLYNLQQWIAPSDGYVESQVGVGDAGKAENSDLWWAPALFGRKNSLSGMVSKNPKHPCLEAWRQPCLRRRFSNNTCCPVWPIRRQTPLYFRLLHLF